VILCSTLAPAISVHGVLPARKFFAARLHEYSNTTSNYVWMDRLPERGNVPFAHVGKLRPKTTIHSPTNRESSIEIQKDWLKSLRSHSATPEFPPEFSPSFLHGGTTVLSCWRSDYSMAASRVFLLRPLDRARTVTLLPESYDVKLATLVFKRYFQRHRVTRPVRWVCPANFLSKLIWEPESHWSYGDQWKRMNAFAFCPTEMGSI